MVGPERSEKYLSLILLMPRRILLDISVLKHLSDDPPMSFSAL